MARIPCNALSCSSRAPRSARRVALPVELAADEMREAYFISDDDRDERMIVIGRLKDYPYNPEKFGISSTQQ